MTGSFSFGPIKYTDIVFLDRAEHKDMAVDPGAQVSVTEGLQACPIMAEEIEPACRHYLITFANETHPTPLAHISLQKTHNPFVLDGSWRPRSYVPKAIRRYPFLLSRPNEDGLRRVLVDRTSLVPADEIPNRRLFEDGADSPFLTRMLEQTHDFQEAINQTEMFQKILTETELLARRRLILPHPDAASIDLGVALVVDEARLAEAPEALISELHRFGVLQLIYAHLISLRPVRVINAALH